MQRKYGVRGPGHKRGIGMLAFKPILREDLEFPEVFSFVFRVSRRVLGAAMTSIIGYQILKLKRPPRTHTRWQQAFDLVAGARVLRVQESINSC